MPEQSFAAQLTAAARTVTRIEVKLRTARRRLAELDEQLRESKRSLRLLVQATEPYTPAMPEETAAALDDAEAV